MGETNKAINDRILAANLTGSESQAVQKVLSSVEKYVFLSASQVAEACNLSPTSITRIIQKLGYPKYVDFKRDLESLYRDQISPSDMFSEFMQSDIKNEVIKQSIQKDYDNLRRMEEELDEDTLRAVAQKIANARKVFIIGMFGSEIVVKSLEYYCWRLGITHEAFTGIGHSKKFIFSDAGPGDVLVAISNQRIFKEVMESVDFANENGIVAVTITDNYTNPLANKADYVLVAPVRGMVFDYTHTATLALIDILSNMVANEMKDEVRNVLLESRASKDNELLCI